MARWSQIEQEAPELVAAARGFLDAGVHETLARCAATGHPVARARGITRVERT